MGRSLLLGTAFTLGCFDPVKEMATETEGSGSTSSTTADATESTSSTTTADTGETSTTASTTDGTDTDDNTDTDTGEPEVCPSACEGAEQNTWTAVTMDGAPEFRSGLTAVWTGEEMIVWGGGAIVTGNVYYSNGGRYDPDTDTWAAISETGAPTGRSNHVSVWTGEEMIVWGGAGADGTVGNGGRYDPRPINGHRWPARPSAPASMPSRCGPVPR